MNKPEKAMGSSRKSTEIQANKENALGLKIVDMLEILHASVGETESSSTGHKTATLRQLALDYTRSGVMGGLRTYLPEYVGKGYWDIIGVCPGIFVSITDATYLKSNILELPAEQLLKIRVICSGSVVFPKDNIRLSEGSSTIQFFRGDRPTEISVEPHSPLRMVVLHALPDALGDLGVTDDMFPEPIRPHRKSVEKVVNYLSVASGSKLIRIAQEMVRSRDYLPNELRTNYIRAKAQELLYETIIRSKPSVNMLVAGNRIRQSDIPRFHEARRILVNCLDSPPTVEQLSRLVGINRTKLKAGFRELFGETIQEYRTRIRLAEARRLIEETELQMAEIGRKIGFQHAANFTQTMKRHFGKSPLELRKSHIAANI